MSKQWKHYHLLIMCAVLVLITTACFRDSAEGVNAQPVSQLLPSDTPIPLEPSVTPTELIEETEEVVFEKPTETSSPTSTTTPTPTITIPPASATMTVDPLLATESSEGVANVGNTVPGGTKVAQAPPDNFALTSTALISQLTQSAAQAATDAAIQAGTGIDTPTPLGPPTVDPALVPPTPVPSQPLAAGVDCVHQIRVGETLYKLSLAYGVSVGEMANASGITNWNIILVGQRITIPGCGTTGFFPPATSVPVPSATPVIVEQASAQTQPQAQTTDLTGTGGATTTTNTDTLAAQAQSDITNNAQADIQANAISQGAAPAVGSRQYTVQQYDTLFQIAQAHGTTVDAIAALNGITNINSITMNTVLQIP
jgi:LysM repeat protein